MNTGTLEVVDLEQMLNAGDCKCESRHIVPGADTCTIEIVARHFCCEWGWRIVCENHAAYVRMVIAREGWYCEACDGLIKDCWRLVAA